MVCSVFGSFGCGLEFFHRSTRCGFWVISAYEILGHGPKSLRPMLIKTFLQYSRCWVRLAFRIVRNLLNCNFFCRRCIYTYNQCLIITGSQVHISTLQGVCRMSVQIACRLPYQNSLLVKCQNDKFFNLHLLWLIVPAHSRLHPIRRMAHLIPMSSLQMIVDTIEAHSDTKLSIQCSILQFGGHLCRDSHSLLRLKNPKVIYSGYL